MNAPVSTTRPEVLAGGPSGPRALEALLEPVLEALREGQRDRGGPLPAGGPERVRTTLANALAPQRTEQDDGAQTAATLAPERAESAEQLLARLTRVLAAHSADPAEPACAAHLHCPPLAVAVAADLAVSALNPSLDSWDQGPAAVEVERDVLREISTLVGYGHAATGTLTSGGTESNLLGMLLARDTAPQGQPAAGRPRAVFSSTAAHFSVRRNAEVLGISPGSLWQVETGADDRMDPGALDAALGQLAGTGTPAVVVATAGSTDLGAVDPLPQLAAVTRRHGAWLHVDAAYGGGALFSERLAPLLDGLDQADTVALDLHKLGWQPVAAGILLARDADLFAPIEQRVAYLNAADDEDAGYRGLLGHSLRTTRRADAFKVAVTLRALGHSGLGALVDRCHDLARHAARRIAAEPDLELTATPVLTTVVFRYHPAPDTAESASPGQCSAAAPAVDPKVVDEYNAQLRRELLATGAAVVGRTELGSESGALRLKLTLLNPDTTLTQVDALVDRVLRVGRRLSGSSTR